MLYLVADRANTIKVEINSGIRLEGFSAVLTACGVTKTISDLTKKELKYEYSAEESNKGGTGVLGELIIKDSEGKVHYKMSPQFKTIPPQESYKAIGTQLLSLTIAPIFEESAGGGGGGGGDVTKEWVDKEIQDAISDIGQTIIQDEEVTVTDPEGQQVTMTVKDSLETVLDLQNQVENNKHVRTEIKDEDQDGKPDGEVLYFKTDKDK